MTMKTHPNPPPSSPVRRALARVSCALALLGAGVLAAQAQSAADTTVLRGQDVNPDKLVELLTPDPEPVLTRGLKVDREASLPAAVRRPSASLLITFETNSARLTPSSRQQLDTVAAALKSNQLQAYGFTLEGHADPRGQAQPPAVADARRERARLPGGHARHPGRPPGADRQGRHRAAQYPGRGRTGKPPGDDRDAAAVNGPIHRTARKDCTC